LSGLAKVLRGDVEGLIDAGELNAAEQFGMALYKCVDVGLLGGLADEVGDVEGEEVAGSEESDRRWQA